MTTSFNNYPPVMAEAFANMANTVAQLGKAQAATQVQMDATSAEVKSAANSIKKLEKLYGNVAHNQGASAEEFFHNTLSHDPVLGEMHFDKLMPNMLIGKKGKQTEFDLVLVNGSAVAVLEIKHTVHASDLDQVEKHLKFFKAHSPEFKNYKLYGGVAGFSIPTDVVKAAHERGYFVLKRHGNVMTSNTKGMRAF